ncbi:NB-ARC domain-containing protein [Streptomyces mirabilis]|uniref:NB-ARC domain-containing protein n=1 Tax=Streptomyces mirabilis TaxID=68239 RepID=UPI003323F928
MGMRGRWGVRVAIALCAAAGVWLLVTAFRSGWNDADPVASVLGGAAGLAALAVSLRADPAPRAIVARPDPPEVPEWWVARDEAGVVIKAVRRRTRRWRGGGSVAITTGLHGAGGFGKTALARYVAAQRSVQRRFPGGVHLVTIGRDVRGRAAVAAKVAEETRLITGDTAETGSDPERAGAHLGNLLSERPRTLLVIDDVWEREQLTPFLRGAERTCVRLVTTRNPDVLPPGAVRIEVDRMTEQQARSLLTHRLPAPPQQDAVEALVKATGRWALLLGIANKFITEQAATGADPTTATRTLLERLRVGGPAVQDPDRTLDLNDPTLRNTAVRSSIKAASTLLQPNDAEERFTELGIFAEDEAIPISLVAALWQVTGGLDEAAARSLCKQMADLSLLGIDTHLPGGSITLHDVVRDYLRTELGTDLAATNAALLDAVAATLPPAEAVAWWQTTNGYLLDHLIEHLIDAGRLSQAESVAGDFRWVRARLHQRGPTAPWRDLDRTSARGLARQLARAAHLLSPTVPPHALDAVLRSRITDVPNWPTGTLLTDAPALIDRWPPPDLPDPVLLRTLTGHTRGVTAVAFSPDGDWLATTSDDATVRIWDPATGITLRTLTGHFGPVAAAAVSPDGAWLATASFDGIVRISIPTTGEVARTLTGNAGGVNAVAFSPDGGKLATASFDGIVQLWDPANGEVVRTLAGHSGPVAAVAFSPDGGKLATASFDDRVWIWDPATGSQLRTLICHAGSVAAVAFSPDGAWLATAGSHDTVWIWDPATGEVVRTLVGHSGSVAAVVFSPDGARLATASDDATMRIWDPATGSILRTLTSHTVRVAAVAFSPDGAWLATGSYDRLVRIWDTASGEAVQAPASRTPAVTAVAFSPNGTWLATVSWDGIVRISAPATGEVVRTLAGHAGPVAAVAFSPDGAWLATASDDATVRIWNPATGITLRTLTGHTGPVAAAAVSPDGAWLATASDDDTVWIWDPATGEVVRTLAGHAGPVAAVAFSPDGAWLATTSDDATVRIWNPATEEALTMMRTESPLTSCSWSPDGHALCVGGHEGLFGYNLHTGLPNA